MCVYWCMHVNAYAGLCVCIRGLCVCIRGLCVCIRGLCVCIRGLCVCIRSGIYAHSGSVCA